MFFRGSRYEAVPEAEFATPDGRVIRYKRLRFIADVRATIPHMVAEGQRLDHIAFEYFRDPEHFWRVCDANLGMWPDDLLVPGRRLMIPIPMG